MFQLTTPTEVKLTAVTARVENHGDDKVPAISLSFHYNGPNTFLDLIDKTLLPRFYDFPESKEIPGVNPMRTVLATRSIDKIKLRNACEEMVMLVEHGIGDTPDSVTSIKAGDCKVSNFRDFDPHDGGTIDITFTVGTNDVNQKDAGTLWSINGKTVRLTIRELEDSERKKKAEQKPPVIDGTVGHPAAKKGKAKAGEKEPEAGDLFAQAVKNCEDQGKPEEQGAERQAGPESTDPSPLAAMIREGDKAAEEDARRAERLKATPKPAAKKTAPAKKKR